MNISQLECTLNASFMRNDDCNLDDVRWLMINAFFNLLTSDTRRVSVAVE